MFRKALTAAALALLCAAPALADNPPRGHDDNGRYDRRHDDRDHDHDRRRGYDKRKYDRHRYDDRRRIDSYYDLFRRDDRYRGYRYSDRDRRPYYAHRYWRHSPPTRYSVSFGYRSGYEQAWLDWHRYGRHDRGWHRGWYSAEFGYRAGYDDGWRDAARYYRYDYGPGYWSRDRGGSWFFGFQISG